MNNDFEDFDKIEVSELDLGSYLIQDVYKIAEMENLIVVETKPNLLMLDYDSEIEVSKSEKLLGLHQKLFDDFHKTPMFVTTSKNGNKHLYIKTEKNYDPIQIVLLQTLLGSDIKRSIIDLKRIQIGYHPFSALLETSKEYEKLKVWLEKCQ